MSWRDLELADPELAAFGVERLRGMVAYFATVRADGAPRVHPVTPIIGGRRLFVFMEPTSPKGKDIERDPRFALHCGVSDDSGGAGEFMVAGRAQRLTDPESRAVAIAGATYQPVDRYILFELHPDRAQSAVYAPTGPLRREWKATP